MHFSRSNIGTPNAPTVIAWPEHIDPGFAGTALAEIRVEESDVVRIPRGRLHLTAHQQRILLRHQQLSVVRNGRPPHPIDQGIVATEAARAALVHDLRQFGGGAIPGDEEVRYSAVY